jgi:hypothetical protein
MLIIGELINVSRKTITAALEYHNQMSIQQDANDKFCKEQKRNSFGCHRSRTAFHALGFTNFHGEYSLN